MIILLFIILPEQYFYRVLNTQSRSKKISLKDGENKNITLILWEDDWKERWFSKVNGLSPKRPV